MKRPGKNKIFIFIIIIILFFSVIVFLRFSNKEEIFVKDQNIEEKYPKNETREYSRISFFLGTPARASLAIPSDWEGQYRIKGNNNILNVYNIENAEDVKTVFYVKYYEDEKWEEKKEDIKEKKIISLNGFVYVYKLSTANYIKKEKFDREEDIFLDFEEIIKSLR